MRYIYIIFFICITASLCRGQDRLKDSIAGKSLFDSAAKAASRKPDTVKFATKAGKINVIKQITIDSGKASAAGKDTLVLKKKHDPHKATIRSAIIPGWGQAYNREYWKIPLVWAAVGIPIGTYIYNNTWYARTRDAYNIVINGQTQNYGLINSKLIDNNTGLPYSANTLQFYRNNFRKDRDYSILVILFAWGLNVVDATVFGHLKDFDVSSDLSMRVQPEYDPTFKTTSLGFAFSFKQKQHKEVDIY